MDWSVIMKSNSKTMEIKNKESVYYLTFPHFTKTNMVRHGFSTRHGGVSEGNLGSMNLGFSRGDLEENVITNYKRLSDAIGVEVDSLVLSDQVHKSNIKVVTAEDRGKGFNRPRDYDNIDGLVTNVPEVTLVTFYADCVPLFFMDPVKKVVGMAHAGWRGTVAQIGGKMIDTMVNTFQCKPGDILVGIGPSIGKCCFEVDEKVYEAFMEVFPEHEKNLVTTGQNHKYMIDLWTANALTLINNGVSEDNIIIGDLCTQCHPDDFHSHRATNGDRGSLVGMIALEKQ